MSQLIANTYRLIKEMGSGGGGIVYLAEHTRLGKQVVLKADKRPITASQEVLRREVDALKNLSHTYIPQVYDFIIEGDTVYTVMDFIEGESFDRPLSRGVKFTQPQVVFWAKQLLQAVKYLHTRPPHGILHADIKPANIMLTPQGDIKLIDFNIALALGEEGAVAVGRSFGYASPESYVETPVAIHSATTVLDTPGSSNSSYSKRIILDPRSDIYSLGATLRHILTAQRPNPRDYTPLTAKDCSPALAQIINKAMDADPTKRYQTADEMLRAFKNIHKNDPRAKGLRRMTAVASVLFLMLFALGGLTTFTGLRQMEAQQTALVMAEWSGNALDAGNIPQAITYALEALPESGGIFIPPHTPQAQLALTNALGVYNLADGFVPHMTIELPGTVFYTAISPDGATAAFVHSLGISIHDTYTGAEIALLPGGNSALAEAAFLNNHTLIYAGQNLTAFCLQTRNILWETNPATALAISGNGQAVAAIYRHNSFANVYNTQTGQLLHTLDFGGKHQRVAPNDIFANPNSNLLALDHTGTWLGVSFVCGSLWLYNLQNTAQYMEIFDATSGFITFSGGFYRNYFAFGANSPERGAFAVICTQAMAQEGGFTSPSAFNVAITPQGINLQTEELLIHFCPTTAEQTPLVDNAHHILAFAPGESHTLIATRENIQFFDPYLNLITQVDTVAHFVEVAGGMAVTGTRDHPVVRIMRLESHPQANVFNFDPSHNYTQARISHCSTTIMFYRHDRFRIYALVTGELIARWEIPEPENVHDIQFRREGGRSYLEVIYRSGHTAHYCALTGGLLQTLQNPAPREDLFEQFFTDTLRIDSPLHHPPRAYCIHTGDFIRELEPQGFLTYVTQVGEEIITQYITTAGHSYGLLLTSQGETLAYLPHLTDVIGNQLFFKYPTGNIRQGRVYFIDELLAMARQN